MPEEVRLWNIQPDNKLRALNKEADADYSGYAGFFKDPGEVEAFLRGLAGLIRR
ncbi:MAG: hypothetical protein WAU45_17145 [Blastocatellia bacterium]